MNSGRRQPRLSLGGLARIESQRDPACVDFAGIDNLSSRGARVTATRRWLVEDHVTLTWLDRGWEPTRARVVYRRLLDDGRCALGLHFDDVQPDMMFGTHPWGGDR